MTHRLSILICAAFSTFALSAQNNYSNQSGAAEAQNSKKMNRIEICRENYTALFGGTALSDEGTDPELMQILQKYIFGEVFAVGDLDRPTRELITCVTLATLQQMPQLRGHAAAALNVGVTALQLREAFYQLAPFIGFPRTLNAVATLNSVFESQGIALSLEKCATVDEQSRHQQGAAADRTGIAADVDKLLDGLPDSANSDVSRFVTELFFGDFMTRTGLDPKLRQLLAYCVCTVLGFDSELDLLVESNLAAGNSLSTLTAAVIQLMPYVGFPAAIASLEVIKNHNTAAE